MRQKAWIRVLLSSITKSQSPLSFGFLVWKPVLKVLTLYVAGGFAEVLDLWSSRRHCRLSTNVHRRFGACLGLHCLVLRPSVQGLYVLINLDFGARRSGPNSWWHHFSAQQCQKIHSASQSLQVRTCREGDTQMFPRAAGRIRWVDNTKMFYTPWS